MELLAPVEAGEAVVGLLGEVVAPAQQLCIHAVGRAQCGHPLRKCGLGEVGVELWHQGTLGAKPALHLPCHGRHHGKCA